MGTEHTTPSDRLIEQHREIEAACCAIHAYATGDDPLELIAAYRRFESAILTHFDAEEMLVLPGYAEQCPAAARQIRDEHEVLRRLLMQLAIDVELHIVRAEQIDELVDLIRAHAVFEAGTLYRWADDHLSAGLPTGQIEHTGYSR